MPTENARLKRFVVTSSLAGAAVLLAAGSTAWACIGGGVASPFIDSPAPSRAIAGAQVQVSGANWAAATPVEIRWDGAGDRLLAQVTPAANGAFSRAVTIPSAATPGMFSIAAHQGDRHSSPVTIEVMTASAAPNGSVPAEPVASGSPDVRTSGGSNTPATVPSQPVANQPDPSEAVPIQPVANQPVPNQSVPDQSAPSQSVPSQPVPTGSAPNPGAPSPVLAPPGFVIAPTGSPAAADRPQGAPSGQAGAFSDAPTFGAGGPQTVAGAPQEAGRLAQAEQAAASPKNPSRDLWSGFADGQDQSSNDVVTLPSSARPGSMLPVGMAVLVGGLISMVAGFGLAELRRRRATA